MDFDIKILENNFFAMLSFSMKFGLKFIKSEFNEIAELADLNYSAKSAISANTLFSELFDFMLIQKVGHQII